MSKYILNGTEYALDDITKFANDLEISVEEYISDNEIQVVDDVIEEQVIDTDPPKKEVEVEEKPKFIPHPDGDDYYKSLAQDQSRGGMMNKEVLDYEQWKLDNPTTKVDPVTNIPITPVEAPTINKVDFQAAIKGPQSFFEEEVSEDFEYVSNNPELDKLIKEKEAREKEQPEQVDLETVSINPDVEELNKYYPGRFKSSRRVLDVVELEVLDTEDLDFRGQPKVVDAENFLYPIRNEINKKEAAVLRNTLKGEEDSYVDLNLNALTNFGQDDVNNFNLQEYYKNGNLTSSARDKIEKAKSKFDRGVYKMVEKDVYNKYKQTGEFDTESFLRAKAGAGDKVFDAEGNLIGMSINADPAPAPMKAGDLGLSEGDVTEINEKTKEFQEKSPTADMLIEARNQTFFELLAIDKNIAKNKEAIEQGNEGVLNNILSFFTGDTDDQINKISQAAYEDSYVGKNINKIMSKHPLAAQHNEKLIQLLALDRAIKLNSNLLTVDAENLVGTYASQLREGLTGIDYENNFTTPRKAAKSFSTALQDAGLVVDEDIVENSIENSALAGGTEVLANITPLLMSIRGAKSMKIGGFKGGKGLGGKFNTKTEYGVKPALKYIDNAFKNLSANKGKGVTKVLNVLKGISKEVVTIAAANEFNETVFNQEKMPLKDAVVFGAGNSAVAGMSKYIATKYIKHFSEFTRTKLGVVVNGTGKLVAGGASATAIGKAAQTVDAATNYLMTGDEVAFKDAMKHVTDIDALTHDLIAFTALGMRGEAVTEVKNRLLAIENRNPRTVAAGKLLGIKEFSTPKEIAEALDKKIKESGIDPFKITNVDNPALNKLKLAAETLNMQNNLVAAKNSIEQSTNNQRTTEAKLDIIAKKLATGQELNVSEVKELGKFSDTPIVDGMNGYNFRSASEAMTNVVAEKLGFKKGSENYKALEFQLALNAEYSNTANRNFKGKSKETQQKKDQYIGKILDAQKLRGENLRLKEIIESNPELSVVHEATIAQNNTKIRDLQTQMETLRTENGVTEKAAFEADVNFAKNAAEKLGVGFKVLDAKGFIDLANKKGFSNTAEGIYLPGENFIYINRDAALEKGAISVASHELSHALTRRAFKNNQGIFTSEGIEALDDFVNNTLSNEQRSVVQDRINKKYNPKSKDFKQKQYEEYLNVFLDGVKRGEFKLNDTFNSKLQSIFKRSVPDVDLTTGEGIKNFVELLDRSGKNGVLDVRLENFYKKGEAAGEAIEGEAKLSSSERSLSKTIDELFPESMTKEEWDKAYSQLVVGDKGLLYEGGRDGKGIFDGLIVEGTGKEKIKIGGDIIIEGENIASKEKFIQDVRDKLKTVIMNFDPTRNESLFGWVTNPNNLNKKKLDVFEDYKKEARARKAARGEVIEGEGIKGTEIEIPAESFQAGRTNPLDLLPSELRAEAIEEVRSKLPKTVEGLKDFLRGKNYKTLKDLTTKTTSKFFGIPEKKITDKKANLSGNEPQRAQMKIAELGGKFIDIIPKNNIEIYKEFDTVDGKRTGKFKYISLGDVGTGKATGLPANIRRQLYTSLGRPKGVNNEVFELKRDLKEADILRVFGIENRVKADDFALRTTDAQTIKGGVELFDRGLGNKIVRDFAIDMGLANEALNLAQGKNVYMASQTEMRDKPSFVERDYTLNHVGPIAERFAKLPYGIKTEETVKQLLNEEFKTGPRKYKTFTDPNTGESYTFTAKDINGLAKSLITAINRAKEVKFLNEPNVKFRSEVNKRNIKEFIEDVVMTEGSVRATEKFFGNLLPKNSKGKTISLKELADVQANQEKRTQLADEMWKTQVKEADNAVDWINDNFGLSEQFNSASKIGDGRFQYYKGIGDFTPKFNEAIKDSGYKVAKEGSKYFIETLDGKRVKQIDRFGKTQSNSNWAIAKIAKSFKDGFWDVNTPEMIEMGELFQDVANRSRKILDKQFEFMMNKYKTGEANAVDLALFTMELKSGMGTVLRMAAPWKKIYQPLAGEALETRQSVVKRDANGNVVKRNGKPVREKLLIWEHSKPAESMIFEMLDIYLKDANVKEVKLENDIIRYELNEAGKKALEKAYDGYEVAIIPKAMDNVITAVGRAEGVEEGVDRYYDDLTYGRPEMRATVDITTGIMEGYEWGIAAEYARDTKLAKVNDKQGEPAFASKSESRNNFDYLKEAENQDNALRNGRIPIKKSKKIRVFDFDDTLARSNNIVVASKEGKTLRLNAEDFAKRGLELKEEGWDLDFSDFNKVTDGSRGPLFDVAERIKNARGNEDLFVLTARAPESRDAIYDFLKAEGLEFKKENIVGLGNSTGEAKAQWLVSKAAEGFNDFYFADDAIQNVKAVKDALSVLDIKSKVQRALASESENRSIEFNKILEAKTGIEYYKEYSAAKAKTIGASKGKFQFFIPYSAEDFTGLIYPTLSKGSKGDAQMAWYKENLLNPFARAMDNLTKDRVQLMSDFKALKKELDVPADLRKTNNSGFTNEQAVRVYLFNKSGFEVPGLSKTDLAELTDIVNKDPKLSAFAEQLMTITKGQDYAKPTENWLVGTLTTDLLDIINTTKRGKYLEEWQRNVDEIYSKENLNKLEAIYGPKYREALENTLLRMKKGKNRLFSGNRLSNKVLDYINGSNAAIMFFNTRSALLQTISSINYLNWSFNNPAKAGVAFANQPQYWSDFTKLMNSDYLRDRRNGLRINIAESEVADAAATSKNKAKAVINYILQKGYLPTQYADSFAIAAGGATFYRNRINDLVKRERMPKAEAEAQALQEWREISEESQQSARPDKISQQQASDAGRLILMFANTPMQYARLQKRAIQDLYNGRGDAKSNVSKIAYYGVVQNLIFNALQQALFKTGFDDDDEKKDKAYYRTANSMLDNALRGLGIGGQAVSVGKNFLMDIYERSNRKRPEYVDAAWKLTQFSPPISSKISRMKSAAYPFDNKKMREQIYEEGFSLDNPALMSGAKVISATTNVPLDRVLQKYDNIEAAMSEEAEWWQTLALLGGWPSWQIIDKKSNTKSKSTSKSKKKTGAKQFSF